MKLFLTIFLFAGFLSTAFISKAQDDIYNAPSPVKHKKDIPENDKKNYPRKINTGFVFIDGKYIEPPYIVKIKNETITINNISAFEYIKIKTKKMKIYKLPVFDLDNIKSWKDIFSNIEIKKVVSYYFGKYKKEEAIKKVSEYVLNLPYIDTAYYFFKSDFLSGVIFKPVNVDTTIMLPISWSKDEITWDKELISQQKKENKNRKYIKDKYEFYISCLENNGTLFFEDGKDFFYLRDVEETKLFFNKAITIINEPGVNIEEKTNKLKEIFSNNKYFPIEIITKQISVDKKLKIRLENIERSKAK